MLELHHKAVDLIKNKFNIIFSIDCRHFDMDYQILLSLIQENKKHQYSHDDRILLVHMDTDYYDELLPCGLLITNIVRIFKEYDIPLYLLLFVTNHYGIKKEFDFLLKNHPKEDYPTIVETLLSVAFLSDNTKSLATINLNDIEKAGLCMMGKHRSHRVALCNFLVNSKLLDNVALQTNFKL